jgi:hypothetical protein
VLEVSQGDLIHIQWNGANTNPGGNAGEGPAGFDRHTLLVQRHTVYHEVGQELNTFNNIGQWGTSYPEPFTQTTGPRFLGLTYDDLYKLAIPPIFSGYFDLGVRQVGGTAPTAYHFLSTRNNNFSNRSQKGKVIVYPRNATDYVTLSLDSLKALQGTDHLGWAWVTYSFDPRRNPQWTLRLSDAGASRGTTHDVLVEPRYLSVPDGASLWLKIEHKWVPFTYGRIFWSPNVTDQPQEVFTMVETWSWDGKGVASAKISVGGYYHVENVVNGSAVGGVSIAVVAALLVAAWFVKRFGCRCWNKTDPAVAAETVKEKENLIPASSSPSSTAAAAPATTSEV